MNLNLETPTFLNYNISSKCHEQSEAQKLRWKIKPVQSSVNLIDKSNICHQIRLKYGTLSLLKEDFSSWNLENILVKLMTCLLLNGQEDESNNQVQFVLWVYLAYPYPA